jgi:DNA-binding beta-propeller fold protein YncE
MNVPLGIVVDPTETFLLIADAGGNKIRRIEIASGNVTTPLGSSGAGWIDAVGTASKFSYPCGLAIDANPDGSIARLFVADQTGNRIRVVNWTTQQVWTIGGNGTAGFALTPGGAQNQTGES